VRLSTSLTPILAWLAMAPAAVLAGNNETEPNDTKAQANAFVLPAVSTPGLITGNSTSAAGAGLDYFHLTTAAQAVPDFYRHRLTIQSATAGHTGTLRGLSQADGVIDPASDVEFAASSTTTVPPRFVQWYTSGAPADIYVRIAGTGATSADYTLDYEVQPVTELEPPFSLAGGNITISTVGQTDTDTELWVYDENRTAIVDSGNDDEFNGTTLQSTLTRSYPPTGQAYYLAISSYSTGNSLASPADDEYRNGNVLDFPGAIANNVTTTNQDVDLVFTDVGGPHPVSATKAGHYDVVFVRFVVALPVELMGFGVE
jgi:hypothetical protein